MAQVGGVPLLVRLLTSQWSALQFEGARALLRLADAQELRQRVDGDLVNALVALVSGKPSESSLPAAVLLDRLSDVETLRSTLLQAEVIERIRKGCTTEGQAPACVELLNRLVAKLENAVPAAAAAPTPTPPSSEQKP